MLFTITIIYVSVHVGMYARFCAVALGDVKIRQLISATCGLHVGVLLLCNHFRDRTEIK